MTINEPRAHAKFGPSAGGLVTDTVSDCHGVATEPRVLHSRRAGHTAPGQRSGRGRERSVDDGCVTPENPALGGRSPVRPEALVAESPVDDPAVPCIPPRVLLSDAVRDEVESLVGSRLTGASALHDGPHSGHCLRLRFAHGIRLLLTCLPADHLLLPRYRAEAAINRRLPARVPVLRLHRAWRSGDWWLMAFHDLSGARHPNLAPGSPDTTRALALLDRLSATVTPAPLPDAPGFVDALDHELGGWQRLADTNADLQPWSARNLDRLCATERFWRHYADGTTLLHADLGPDTMLLADAGDVVTDWAFPHQGAAWVEPAMLLPHLIRAGHTPDQAERLVEATVTAWVEAPPGALTFFAIALTGYWERTSRLPAPPRAPYLRLYQAQMAVIGRAWIQHRTDWT